MSEIVISDVKVWPTKTANEFIKANAKFVVNGAFKLSATVRNGQNGLYVSFPGTSGEKPGPDGKKPFYPHIELINKEVRQNLQNTVLAEYYKAAGITPPNPMDQGSPKVEDQTKTPATIPFG